MNCFRRPFLAVSLVFITAGIALAADRTGEALRFEFGARDATPARPPCIPMTSIRPRAATALSPARASGRSAVDQRRSSISGDQSFLFSAKVPEGNYRVTVTFGDANAAGEVTLKARPTPTDA